MSRHLHNIILKDHKCILSIIFVDMWINISQCDVLNQSRIVDITYIFCLRIVFVILNY